MICHNSSPLTRAGSLSASWRGLESRFPLCRRADDCSELRRADLPEAALTFPGPWQFSVPKGGIILVSDQQLEDLQDPDKEVDLSVSTTPNLTTLRKICEGAKAQGARTVILAFDEFWSQYRKGQGGKPRQLLPDTEAYIQRLGKISQTLKQYGLGLELSLLSPLEIGRGYQQKTGESGRWVQYREGYRDPATGRFTVSLWEQRRWTNNKGTIELQPDGRAGIRVSGASDGRDQFLPGQPGGHSGAEGEPGNRRGRIGPAQHPRPPVNGPGARRDAGRRRWIASWWW